MSEAERAPSGVDPTVPSVARMYDYYLGGKDHFAADRAAAERIIALGRETGNDVREMARQNRAFLGRAVRHMAEQGVRQFLDIGTGLPTRDNVHQVAQRVAPDARVVYVDNDPIVLVHARALLTGDPCTTVIDGDLRDPKAVLGAAAAHLDLDEPVGVLLLAILHFVPDDDEVASIVAALREPLVPGSHLAISHVHEGTVDAAKAAEAGQVYSRTTSGSITNRDQHRLAVLFEGTELLDPGVVPVSAWRPDPDWAYETEVDFTKPGFLGGTGRIA
ncbi:SAM-dependent methyltransferase [Nonomuraea sp. NPDC046570]|uniref:SAM-dependent methyltransferase n=1 Tax=Nonomuraea sp. NPDC046570 TaxID=3155255 RepID=UPI0033D554D4